jgi:hypothetical protein
MAGKFDVDRDSSTVTLATYPTQPFEEPRVPKQGWQFVDGFQRLLGDDAEPDALFFVESWTLGVSVAVEKFLQRRKQQPDRNCRSDVSSGIENRGTMSMNQETELRAGLPSSACTATSGLLDAGCWQQKYQEAAKEVDGDAELHSETPAAEPSSEDTDSAMTLHRACQLLGVDEARTRAQIRGAYRRKVRQWHPDRMECESEEDRRFATEQMATINQAYELLCSLLHK